VGAAFVLGLNLIALTLAGSLTLWIQLRRGHSIAGRRMHGPPLPPGRAGQMSTRPPARQ